ncbi:Alkaline phosphatase D precursor [Planctopirus ephydatiae]|uniref:Alkaline phosphatase D n=1 Tax=Planctopirus ephydatiae TaxID=2528019 RepID=A0A518GTD6_9PLAN|nr:alkaline phosphatase D family protein [Planctopirus ephydatiae]QDV31829.1 Alkaline phosphatase D precursor [Planctopirus ephydatiae]
MTNVTISAGWNRREFMTAAGTLVMATGANPLLAADQPVREVIGPVLGHVDHQQAYLFCRAPGATSVRLSLENGQGQRILQLESAPEKAHDDCVTFSLQNLQPGTSYRGQLVTTGSTSLFGADNFDGKFTFTTPAAPETPATITLGLGSCVSSTEFDDLWNQIAAHKVDGFCLLGDTPYIDTNDLSRNRLARRKFWGTLPTLRMLATKIPFWNTWDDHDFGKNDSDGLMPKKEDIRQAFLEYNALANFGENNEGIYTSFHRGPVEVWLIDDRWFSQTASSWADPAQKTCLGQAQWDWLQRTLKASTAPFKILCTGMVWYPKGNKEKDHWETYSAERDALFAWIKQQQISGVMLISGDIHVSRHHVYGPERVGYPLHECVVSPMHASVNPSLDVQHPARVWSKPAPNVFLKLVASNLESQPKLTATWINRQGEELHSFDWIA